MHPEPRRRWPWLLLLAYTCQLGLVVHATAWHIGRPLGGIIPHGGPGDDSHLYAMPTSPEAARFRDGRTLLLLRINGRDTCETPTGPRCGQDWARSLIDTSPGARNHFVVQAADDDTHDSVVLTAGPADAASVLSWAHLNLVLSLLGLVYAAIATVVWRRRPDDPAALPFLLFGVSMAYALTGVDYVDAVTRLGYAIGVGFSGLLMPFLFLFAHSFATRGDASGTRSFRLLLACGLAVGLGEAGAHLLVSAGVHALRPWTGLATPLIAASAVVALALSLHTTWRASRPPSPLAQRRRARVLALAVGLGFAFPTMWLMFRDLIYREGLDLIAFWMLVASFSTMPALIGYAMVRHRMFDLRIVMRQGLVYTLLSLALALAYVGAVVGAYQLAGSPDSPAAPVVAAVAVAVLFGVVRVRLERWIDGMVFRGRALFRRAIELAGKALADAREPADVAPALRPVLVQALGLSRAYLLERDADGERAHCFVVDNRMDPETGLPPPPLPEQFFIEESPALSHCFARAVPVLSVDPAVERDDVSLWDRHGLEACVPFGSDQDERAAGLLLLGPKENGRPFDPEEIGLVEALGRQVALAMANARAFERLAESGKTLLRLTQGIVHEANTPLGALESSADTLGRALDHVAESDDPKRRDRALKGGQASLATVRTSSARLQALIGDLKAYVNLEETDRVPTDLRACLAEVVDDVRTSSGHAIELECPEEPALVDGYPTKLRHVFHGIMENAIAASEGGAPVRVAVTRHGSQWLSTVRDSGVGMAPDVLARVFDFGIATKRTQARVGLRIGLPYARRVVESLDGRISIRSQPGEGTEVRIVVPARAGD